ncbi:cobalt-zinc-cadmium efflux system membrane fusion protein [Pseudoduganella lurida]|uniref:Cobalt-zinc-cadmium efflux system membrane fusion protein n=1 Tax=Pseudoduganella lurida TaxID=1036180 RepID=A0A562RBI4_9BURK|nr:efflux RND transporter periplasmic adaptor subunit [Pseudoduganella lurida]TWI66421.1 cobalt-zinc-cadmium efflux system membrane fusion protein [Pseudoduganella lurida]
MKRHQLYVIAAIVALGLVLGVAIWLTSGHDAAPEAAATENHDHVPFDAARIRTAGITLATAGPAPLSVSMTLPGEIHANADRTAHVVPRVPGRVERVLADLGQRVRKGQLLAVVSSDELAERRSTLFAAQRRLDLARETVVREEKLWRERISPEQDVLQARAAHAEAQIAARNAQARLAVLGAGQTGRLDTYELRAPIDGTVLQKHIAVGEAVGNDTAIFTMSDLATVWAEVAASPADLNRLAVGTKATIRAPALGLSAEGAVVQVGAALGEQTRQATARIALSNTGGAWRPGLLVDAVVPAPPVAAAVAVRSDAIHTVEGRSVLFLPAQGGFTIRPVRTGRTDGKLTEVVAGLPAGTPYAAANSWLLKAELGKEGDEHGH